MRKTTREYLQEKYSWDENVFNTVDWKIHGRALSRLSWRKRLIVTKLIHRWLPVNYKLFKYRAADDDKCKACGAVETQFHMFGCQCNTNINTRKLAWAEFSKATEKIMHEMTRVHMWYGLAEVFGGCHPEEGPVYDGVE